MNVVKYASIYIGLTVCFWAVFTVLILVLPKLGFGSMVELSLKMSKGSPLFAMLILPKMFAKEYRRQAARQEIVTLVLIVVPVLAVLSMAAYAGMTQALLFGLFQQAPEMAYFFTANYEYQAVTVFCALLALLWIFPKQVQGWLKRLTP